MINFNFNIIEAQRTSPGPINENTIEYVLVGGGAGGNAGKGVLGEGGRGGEGGDVVSGSFQVQHLTSFSWVVGKAGNGQAYPNPNLIDVFSGNTGSASTITYNASTVATAAGGDALGPNQNDANGGVNGFLSPFGGQPSLYGENGGGDTTTGGTGEGGGQLPNNYPFGNGVDPTTTPNAFDYTGGGGGGADYDGNGGDGGDGVVQLRIYDPRHVWDWEYTATPIYSASYDSDGYTYIFFGQDGSLTFLGKKD